MSLRFQGPTAEELAATMSRDGETTTKRALRQQRKAAQKVMEESIANAPVDKGNLEAAHEITERRGSANRVETTVEVGGVVNGVDVDDYAWEMHEGDYDLGPRSAAKQASDPSHAVGREYLQRAMDDVEKELDAIFDEAFSGIFR